MKSIAGTYKYPGKMILFGEHTVIHGSRALAAPTPGFGGNWIGSAGVDNQSQCCDLFAFAAYIKANADKMNSPINIDLLLTDLDQGFAFQSNIPVGYGLGSSGALCAALYNQYRVQDSDNLRDIRSDLAIMEGYFHGRSSGLDPLVSYTGQVILVDTGGEHILKIPPKAIQYFQLENTGFPRNGQAMISWFAMQMEQEFFIRQLQLNYLPILESCIEAFIAGAYADLNALMFDLSYFQLVHFNHLIPQPFIRVWEEQLRQNTGYYKICGAGGGGFLLRYFYMEE